MLEQGGGEEDSHCAPVAFTVELRPQDTPDGGSVGFMVPTEQVYTIALPSYLFRLVLILASYLL